MTKTPALLTLPQCKNRSPCKWLSLEGCEEGGGFVRAPYWKPSHGKQNSRKEKGFYFVQHVKSDIIEHEESNLMSLCRDCNVEEKWLPHEHSREGGNWGGVMKYQIDFEQLSAEGRAIELAEKLGSNTGRIDFLEENPYGAGIIEAREELSGMTAMLGQNLYMNFWAVFECAYKRAWEKEQNR